MYYSLSRDMLEKIFEKQIVEDGLVLREELSRELLRERNCQEMSCERGIVKKVIAREELLENEIA